MSIEERAVLCNMAAELGAETGMVETDEVTADFLKNNIEVWESDPHASVLAHHRFDAGELAPQVAAPHSPANTRPVTEFANVQPQLAYIGACTGAKLEDLRMAAKVLKGKKARIRLLVAPASLRDQQTAEQDGTLQILLDAGAESCPMPAASARATASTCCPRTWSRISSTARNFKGRMGAASSEVYLASPYTVAASALAGRHRRPARDAAMRAWVFGDNVDTDLIAPGRYMKFGVEEIAPHCFEAVLPEFARTVKPGDVVVGGRNFGAGSSREQAPAALKHLGIAALVAESFAGLFYRNALNLGLPAVVCAAARKIRDQDAIRVDAEAGRIENLSTSNTWLCLVPSFAVGLASRAAVELHGSLPSRRASTTRLCPASASSHVW